MDVIQKYFQDIDPEKKDKISRLEQLYIHWNQQINVISRKDIEHFYVHHVLHSLAIAFAFDFKPGTTILDVGTGGGFPGIPLAILFPEVDFVLTDSIGKKIFVVNEVREALGLHNVKAIHMRAERMHESFDFVVSRAVTNLPEFVAMVGTRVARRGFNDVPNGIIYLKGGDFSEELRQISKWYSRIYNLSDYLNEPYFETKKMVHLSREFLS